MSGERSGTNSAYGPSIARVVLIIVYHANTPWGRARKEGRQLFDLICGRTVLGLWLLA